VRPDESRPRFAPLAEALQGGDDCGVSPAGTKLSNVLQESLRAGFRPDSPSEGEKSVRDG